MASVQVLTWLQDGRQRGAQHVWLSGGEPTLRADFLATLRAAKRLGYQRIKVQSNGMLFSYPGFTERAVRAGLTEVNLLLKSLRADRHDALQRTPGSHALLQQAVTVLRSHPVYLGGDILVTAENWQELPELVHHYASLGFRHFNAWLFSLVDQGDQDLRALVPRLTDIVPALLAARQAAIAQGATFCSLNTTPCVVPAEAWDMQFDTAALDLVVVNPGRPAFALSDSAMEQRVRVAACTACAARDVCSGMRGDYLAVHGEGEFRTLTAADVAGRDPRGRALDDAL